MAGKSLLRLAKNAVKRGQGSQPQRFLFTLRPTCIEGLHKLDEVMLLWQGGGWKLQSTMVTTVDKSTGRVIFDKTCQLRQTTTVYKKGDAYDAKEYTFKLQSVKTHKGVDQTSTVAKYKVDFTDFCRLGVTGGEEELELTFAGQDKARYVLRAFVGATFLKNVDPNEEQSEVSAMTSPLSMDDNGETYRNDHEQDLTGFHDLTRSSAPAGDSFSATSSSSSPSPESKARGRHKKSHSMIIDPLTTISEGSASSHSALENDLGRTSFPLASSSKPVTPPLPDDKGRGAGGFSLLRLGKRAQPAASTAVAAPAELTPEQVARLRSQREKVDIQAEEDIDALREKCLVLLSARDVIQSQAAELKQLLQHAQADVQSDHQITQDLVAAKLALADSEYEKLNLKLALQIESNRTRVLSSKLTSLAVEHDLFLANRR